MKKICFVFDVFLFGGIEKVAINYLQMLSPQEYDIDIFILSRYEEMIEQIPAYCHVTYLDCPYYAMPESRASTMIKRNGGAWIYYTTFFLKKLKEPFYRMKFRNYTGKQYDVAIAFSGHLNDIYFVDEFIRANKKIVWCHGMIYQYLLLSPAFEKRYCHFDHLVSINHLDQSEIFVHKPYLHYDIVHMYNPIPNEMAKVDHAKVMEIKEKYGPFVVMVARLSPPKDPFTVIKAFARLYQENEDFQHRLIFVGDGEYREQMQSMIDAYGYHDRIFCVGSKSNVMDYYAAADLCVLSSLAEGLPTVILEAMQMGVPVIATEAQWGVNDILGSNEYGWIVPLKDDRKLAAAIYTVLHDDELYQRYVDKGKQRVQDFLPATIKCEFEQLLNRRSADIE